MTRLFDAYFRVTDDKSPNALTDRVLLLVPPVFTGDSRHDFYAAFTKNNGWLAKARVKDKYLTTTIAGRK